MIKTLAAAVVAVAAVSPALAAPGNEDSEPLTEAESKATSKELAQCSLTSRIFYRLAEQRDGGADPKAAVTRVAQYLADLGATGSHLKYDFRQAVEASVAFVYQQTGLNPTTLSSFGFRSCQLQQKFARDEVRRDAGFSLLLDAAGACQKRFPGTRYNNQLRECIKDQGETIAERVRTARVEG